jgi:hypothetical protein
VQFDTVAEVEVLQMNVFALRFDTLWQWATCSHCQPRWLAIATNFASP